MKLTNIDFLSTNLGNHLLGKKSPDSVDIYKLLTNFFKKESFETARLFGFEYNKNQFNQLVEFIKSDKQAIIKIDDSVSANMNENIRYRWTMFTDFKNVKDGTFFETIDKKILTDSEINNIVGYVEQNHSNLDYVYQECNYTSFQFANNFSKQVAHEGESKQECGSYSVQICVNDSWQNSGNYCEVFGGETVNQETNSYSKLTAGNDATQIANEYCTLVAKDFAKQQTNDNCSLISGDKSTIDAENNCIINTGDESTIKSGNFCNIETRGFAIIRTGHNSTIDAWYNCQLTCGDNCTISIDAGFDIKCGNNTYIKEIKDGGTITLNGDNLIIEKVGMFTTIIVNSSYGNYRYESYTDFPEFNKLVIENGQIIS